jgi:hypothetical protein
VSGAYRSRRMRSPGAERVPRGWVSSSLPRFLTGHGYAADSLVGARRGGGGRGRGCAAEGSLGLTISGFLTPHARRLRLRWRARRPFHAEGELVEVLVVLRMSDRALRVATSRGGPKWIASSTEKRARLGVKAQAAVSRARPVVDRWSHPKAAASATGLAAAKHRRAASASSIVGLARCPDAPAPTRWSTVPTLPLFCLQSG